jgi:hypothetical protein
MNKTSLFLVLSALSFAFAQEGAIKFQLSLDSTGMPIAAPPKPEAPQQKVILTSNRPLTLNLAELSAKDTDNFEIYSQRRALVQDSISAMQKEIENSKKRTASQMPPLEPKGEYEKQSEFDARKEKRERELGERMLRDYKPFADRLSELEKAKKKIEDNQAALYCTVEIKTNPVAASILLNKEEIGISPAEYSLALPGNTVIRILKENYEPWDTTLTMQPAQKLKLNVTLQEKSIFSKEGEIDFQKIIAKDTITKGYLKRIGRVKARIVQIDAEIVKILEDFSNTYPALEPQKSDETAQAYESRKTAWRNEGVRQVGVLRYKHEAYKNKLVRSLKVLENNIIATESQLITETPLNARITLGAYDVEKEVFEVEVQDSANAKSPFYFAGWVGIPRDTAKAMNRSTDGFLVGVSYLNYPFVLNDSSSFNLAMKELALSRKAVSLKMGGGFKPLSKFEYMEGYGPWRIHADSLLSNTLKVNTCLDLDYVIGKKSCGEPTTVAEAPSAGSMPLPDLGWRGWTRILTFTAAAALGAVAVVKQLDLVKKTDKLNAMYEDPRYHEDRPNWQKDWEAKNKDFNDVAMSRNIFGAGAGVFAVAGILTFVF